MRHQPHPHLCKLENRVDKRVLHGCAYVESTGVLGSALYRNVIAVKQVPVDRVRIAT
jgi:hypothetical protein